MPKRILIAGAGFAGLWSALGAARVLDKNGKAEGTVEIRGPTVFPSRDPSGFYGAEPQELHT